MDISSYSELLTAARAQATPQRLLFAFAAAQLPGDASAEQRQSYAQQQGGTLTPVLCVDKMIDDLADFPQLVQKIAADRRTLESHVCRQHAGAFDPGGRRCSIGRGGVKKDADSDKSGSGG
jgi:hypothetical protein